MDGLIIILLVVVVTIARNVKKLAEAGKRASNKGPVGKQAPVQRFDPKPAKVSESKAQRRLDLERQSPSPVPAPHKPEPDPSDNDDVFVRKDFDKKPEDTTTDRVYQPISADSMEEDTVIRKALLPAFSANDMVRAVVMHEVLTRPAHRRQRHGGKR